MSADENTFDPCQPFRSVLLPPDRLKELSRLRPRRAILDIAVSWSCILIAWAIVAVQPAWYTIIPAIMAIASRYYALTIVGHDGLHRRLFDNKMRNDFFNDLLVMAPIGAITRLNNLNHLNHHAQLATERDPDRFKHACFNKAESLDFILYLTGLGVIRQRLRRVFLKSGVVDATNDDGGEVKDYTRRDLLMLAGWQVSLIVGLSFFVGWWAYPVLWLLPVYLGAYVSDNIRSFAEHSHPEADHLADRHRLITYTSNPLERAMLAPMNMNYHATHHLYTSIPYYNLPKADAEIRRKPEASGLEWRGSYVVYLVRYYFALPLVECLPATVIKAEPVRK